MNSLKTGLVPATRQSVLLNDLLCPHAAPAPVRFDRSALRCAHALHTHRCDEWTCDLLLALAES